MADQSELINAMSDEDIVEMKGKYADNASVILLLDGILESRAKQAVEAKAKADFEKGITKLFSKLPHPEDIHNVYVRWGEVEVPTGEPEEVEVVGNDGEKTMEMRQPTTKQYQWIVSVNKSVSVASGASGKGSNTGKRAVKVFKRNGTQLEDKGNYASATKACEALGLTIGGDSATRVLARDSYIVEPYTGNLDS